MSVADSISGALQRFGRPMVLRRLTLGPAGVQIPFDVTVYGRSKNYDVPSNQGTGSVVQGGSEITITNAEISAAQWPGPPATGDRLVIDGWERYVESVEPKYLGTEVLVYICHVRG